MPDRASPFAPGRRALLSTAAGLVAAPLLPSGRARAAAPLRLVVPFTPGGVPDTFARLVAPALGAAMNRAAVVENVSGAASRLGTATVTRAAPDGGTLLLTNDTLAATEALPPPGGEALLPGLRAITLAVAAPNVLLTHPGPGLADIGAYAARMRAEPGVLNVAVPGWGTAHHLMSEVLNRELGGRVEHIPYRGMTQVVADLLVGRVDAAVLTLSAVLEHLREGRLVALAVSGRERAAVAPRVPTLSETVAPGFEYLSWQGLLAPAGLPDEIAERLFGTVSAAMAGPLVRERLATLGLDVVAEDPARFAARLDGTVTRFAAAVSASGIRAEKA